MKRWYGLIKNADSANQFINDLYSAADTSEGNPIKVLSNYTEGLSKPETSFLDRVYSTNYSDSILDENSKKVVLNSLTYELLEERATVIDSSSPHDEVENYYSSVAALGSNLFIVANGKHQDAEYSNNQRSRVRIVHRYTENNVTTASYMDLLGVNSNWAADCIVYEITATKSGDILVKLATATESAASTELELKTVFTAFNINAYSANITSGVGYIISAGLRHTGATCGLGANGEYGGFIIHKMKKKRQEVTQENSMLGTSSVMDDGSIYRYGITLFNCDGSPLYTFADDGKPWYIVENGVMPYVNPPLGRNINPVLLDPEDPRSEPLIVMSSLAPVLCPAVDDIAMNAKWMHQGAHDYSYFDDTGHIHLKGQFSSMAFFMDHGVALYDGSTSDYSLSNKMVPDIDASNMLIYTRPNIETPMPYSDHMYAYFDSLAGLSEGGWMNFRDENNDMIFGGTPTILSDGACRFSGSITRSNYGYFNGTWHPYEQGDVEGTYRSTIVYLVFKVSRTKVPNWPIAQDEGGRYSSYINTILSNMSPTYGGNNDKLMAYIGLAYESNRVSGFKDPSLFATTDNYHTSNQYINNIQGLCNDYMAMALAWEPQNGNYLAYKIFKNGSLIKSGTIAHPGLSSGGKGAYWVLGGGAKKGSSLAPPRYSTLWGIPNWNPSGGRSFGEYPSNYPDDGGTTYFDVKFCAIGNMSQHVDPQQGTPREDALNYDYFHNPAMVDESLEYLCRRFNV